MSLKQRIYDLLLPLPAAATQPAPSMFSDAERAKRVQEEKTRYLLNMEIERRRGMVGV